MCNNIGPTDDLDCVTCVAHLYRLLLNRPADRSGLLHHADNLVAGGSLPDLTDALLDSDEGRLIWDGMPDRQIARALWHGTRPDGDGGNHDPIDDTLFETSWTASPDLGTFISRLVRSERAQRTSILPCLFPEGVDPLQDDVYRAWAYRLWSVEVERVLSDRARRLLPSLRVAGPVIGLTIELGASDGASSLDATIASLSRQIYGRWRLVLQGALPAGFVPPADPRISVAPLPGPCASGRWVGWLRPGDTLSPSALALFGYTLLRRPRAVVVYCDEDLRRPNGVCSNPVLKAAWDPYAAEQADVTGGLTLFRKRHLARRGGDRCGLAAHVRLNRATRRIAASRVAHLPAILCHRLGQSALPVAAPVSLHPRTRLAVSVVIATRDHASLLERCVRSLAACTDYRPVEIVLVDNGTTDHDALALLDRLQAEGCLVLRRPGPFNWSGLNNDGVRASSGEIVVLMNNDIECVEPRWLDAMVSACLRPEVGVVGARLLFQDGGVQHAGVLVGPGPHAAHAWDGGMDAPLRTFAAVTGACMAFRRSVFDRLGGLDAKALPVTWNDIDFCLRAREAGWQVLLASHAVLLHDECGSRTADTAAENQPELRRARAYVARRHRRALRADPFLNPLLTVQSGGRLLDPLAPRTIWPILRAGGR